MATEKTWAQLQDEIEETFRKWGRVAPTITCILPKRSAAKRFQSEAERAVSISFGWLVRGEGNRDIRLQVKRGERAIDNLALIAKALEMMRLADVRDLRDLIVLLYRQIYPEMRGASPPPPRTEVPPPTGPYAVLHVAMDAPIEVCEAAYRALVKKHHPDLGGNTPAMQRLNAAIEQIRKEQAR